MIIEISSSLEKFKTLQFGPGLNLLLSDTSDAEAKGRTRNSAGKSSTVQIVDFLLGASADKKSVFRSDALVDAEFTGKFQIGTEVFSVSRSGAAPSKVFLNEGQKALNDMLETDKDTGRRYLSNSDWCRYLGHRYFGLPLRPESGEFAKKNAPTYRSMIKYFLRLDGDGGFSHPERNTENQQKSSYQAGLSYIFGLEWRIAQELQGVRDREAALKALKKVAGPQTASEMVGTVAQLRGKAALAERKAQAKRTAIANFEVMESYRETADRASELRMILQDVSRKLISLKETRRFLEQAFETESPAYTVDVAAMYRASGIELPEMALRRFDDVQAFQQSITSNRKFHLESEIGAAQREVEAMEASLRLASDERKELLASLEGKGAFEDLVTLQTEAAALEAEAATLKERLEAAEALESDKAELKVDRLKLQRRLQADHATHEKRLKEIIVRIAELIAELYADRDGYFEASATDNGPEFSIHIEGDRGTGIRSMEIFCMDIAIYEAVHSRFTGPGFLVHDSHLFDGVDARQIAAALQIGQRMVGESGQYLVTLNSDVFETLPFEEGFESDDIIVPVRLSDEGDASGLFGFRFE